jgi:hypothetical protein
VEGDLIRARWVANQIAIERAINTTGAKRVISFHSRVSRAKEFSTGGSRGVRQFLPEFSVFHVNGEQKSSERKQLIRAFRDAPRALITNARCLTEGIDVPAVDMVAFIDPRHSKIDIAQATGRAMRRIGGADKEVGYVVVPVFLERTKGETISEAVQRSDFADVADVLNAMQEQNDDLVQLIREFQEAKGRGEIFDPRRLLDEIEVLGPSVELSVLQSRICAEIVDAIGVSWDMWFGVLTKYKNREGHCRVPPSHLEGTLKLGLWVTRQRRFKDVMPIERRHRLAGIGFEWNPVGSAWEQHYSALKGFNIREGHTVVPHFHIEKNLKLGEWVIRQRRFKDTMPVERRRRLEAIGFVWDALDAAWDEGFAALTRFIEREGHCRVSSRHMEGTYRLGAWVQLQRFVRDRMPVERRKRLEAIGLDWDARDAGWEEGFAKLRKFKLREGHCHVPSQHIEDRFNLGTWATYQYKIRDTMPTDRRERLEAVGFEWSKERLREKSWEEGFAALTRYREREGHCRVPAAHIEGAFRLGTWVQRQRKSRVILPAEQRECLNQAGFEWDPLGAAWENGLVALMEFKDREGHCGVPTDHVEGTFRLGNWVAWQRKNRDTMPPDRKERLKTIGFIWEPEPFGSAWEAGYTALKKFVARGGHCRVPQRHVEGSFKLGAWVNSQRNKQDTLSAERKRRLDELGFVWREKKAADSLMRPQKLEG